MIVFGIIDNLGLFVGMDFIEDYVINNGYNSLVAAGIGNTFSDIVGALFGGIIASFLFKLLKVEEDSITTLHQVVGVTIGCMIPVIIAMILI
jgi:uncharacterized membrane protein